MGADLLILLSDVEGIYTGHPNDPSSRLIRTYYPEHENDIKFWGKSRVGKGGMESKVGVVWGREVRGMESMMGGAWGRVGVLIRECFLEPQKMVLFLDQLFVCSFVDSAEVSSGGSSARYGGGHSQWPQAGGDHSGHCQG